MKPTLTTNWTKLYVIMIRSLNSLKITAKQRDFVTYLRSSRLEVFCKKGILKNFAKFTRKHLCQSLFFNKLFFKKKTLTRRPATLFKKRLWHRSFPVNFAKFLRRPFFKEHEWLLLLPLWNCEIPFPFWLTNLHPLTR